MKRRLKVILRVMIAGILILAVAGAGWIFSVNRKVLRAERPLTPEAAEALQASIIEPDRFDLPEAVKIVGLGEYSHGNRRPQTLRLDITERMARDGSLRALVLEMPYVDGLAVDAYIRGRSEQSLETVMQSFHYFLYRTEEMKALFQRLKAMNEQGADIRVYGIDIQEWERPRDTLNATLDTYGIEERLEGMESDTLASIRDRLSALDLGEARTNIMLNLKVLEAEIAYARAAEATMDYQSYTQEAVDLRDRVMAELTMWLQEQEQGTVLFMGHNHHVRRTPEQGVTAGSVIAETLGDAYYAIGTLPGKTTFLAMDAGWTGQVGEHATLRTFTLTHRSDLAKAFSPLRREVMLPLHDLPDSLRTFLDQTHHLLSVGASFGKLQKLIQTGDYEALNPLEAFDALFYLPDDTPYTLIPAGKS